MRDNVIVSLKQNPDIIQGVVEIPPHILKGRKKTNANIISLLFKDDTFYSLGFKNDILYLPYTVVDNF